MPTSNPNPNNGFCSKTLTFHSLRPPSPLPSPSSSLSVTTFIFSLLQSYTTTTTTTATSSSPPSFIDSTPTSNLTIPYPTLPSLINNLSLSLRHLSLSNHHSALIISSNSSYVPVLYLSLFSIGVVVSPINPASSIEEISNVIRLCKPVVAFVTVEVVEKVKQAGFRNRIVVIESDEFVSMMSGVSNDVTSVGVLQLDTAAILYSSGGLLTDLIGVWRE